MDNIPNMPTAISIVLKEPQDTIHSQQPMVQIPPNTIVQTATLVLCDTVRHQSDRNWYEDFLGMVITINYSVVSLHPRDLGLLPIYTIFLLH